jgi:methionyl-tRNA formyltransferase
MKLEGVLFLAARTARSQAYAQCMAAHGIDPEQVLIYGGNKSGRPGQSVDVSSKRIKQSIFVPDLSIPLLDSCRSRQWDITTLATESVNSPEILETLRDISPELVVYSGYGGEIVSSELLGLNAPFLHIHGGWLPDFRGSTTIYYSILQERNCAVSAILLSNEIDTGPVIAREAYPVPPAGVDVDYVYDSAIRADLLVKVLGEYASHGGWRTLSPQKIEEGRDYYVIHPVLKHLAMLAIGNR